MDVHTASEVLFRLCTNTDPQRDSIFTKGLADVLDHATSEIAGAANSASSRGTFAATALRWMIYFTMSQGRH